MKIRPNSSPRLSVNSVVLTLLPLAAFFLYLSLSPQTVNADAGITITASPTAQTIDLGGQASYTLTLTNNSTAGEDITVDLDDASTANVLASFVPSGTGITIPDGESRTVTVILDPPGTAAHGTSYDTTIEATATENDGATSTATAEIDLVTTVVDSGSIDPVIVRSETASGSAGTTVTIEHLVRNNGTRSDTFKFSVSSRRGYAVSIDGADTRTIGPNGGETTVRYDVTIRSSADSNEVDDITFSMVSQLDPRQSVSVIDVLTVNNQTATSTPTPQVFEGNYEPNDTLQTAYEIFPGRSNRLCGATFWPTGDIDFYRFKTQAGLQYVIETEDLDVGIDPFMTLYGSNGQQGVQNDNLEPTDLNARIGFIAGENGYTYISIENNSTGDPANKTYCVVLAETLVTPTPTPSRTPTPTQTPTETPTITLTPSITPAGDECEPNETAADACFLAIGQTTSGDFEPPYGQADDKDFYKIFVRRGIEYTCTTSNLSSYADTKMEVRQAQGYVWLGDNNDRIPLNPGSGSEVVFRPAIDGDVYVIITAFTRPEKDIESRYTYDLQCEGASPTSTPEPTETPEPTSTADFADIGDECEPNETPADACFISTGQTIGNNFAAPPGLRTDTDYFRMFVRQGVLYTCTTFNLSSFADTRLEIRQEQGFAWLGDNNDAIPFDPQSGSEVQFQAKVDGNVFIIVRPFTQPEPELETQYTYDLRCSSEAPTITPTPSETPLPTATPRPTSRPVVVAPPSNGGSQPNVPPPTDTPQPLPTQPPVPTPTPFQTATPTLTPVVNVVPNPTQVPIETPPPANVSLDVLIYYDANENFSAESTEGIMDVAVSVYDNQTGELLAFGYTNGNGVVSFTGLQPQGALRVNVDYLGFNQVVPANAGQIPIRISPQQMPNLVP